MSSSRCIRCPICRKPSNVEFPKDLLFVSGSDDVKGAECSICRSNVADVLLDCHHLTVCHECVSNMPESRLRSIINSDIVDSYNNACAISLAIYYIVFLALVVHNMVDIGFDFLGIELSIRLACNLRGYFYLMLIGMRIVSLACTHTPAIRLIRAERVLIFILGTYEIFSLGLCAYQQIFTLK